MRGIFAILFCTATLAVPHPPRPHLPAPPPPSPAHDPAVRLWAAAEAVCPFVAVTARVLLNLPDRSPLISALTGSRVDGLSAVEAFLSSAPPSPPPQAKPPRPPHPPPPPREEVASVFASAAGKALQSLLAQAKGALTTANTDAQLFLALCWTPLGVPAAVWGLSSLESLVVSGR